MEDYTEILGVKISTLSKEEILKYLVEELIKSKKLSKAQRDKQKKTLIFTPNPEQISQASSNPSLKAVLNSASINLPDGVGVALAAKLLNKPIKARITGSDFMEDLLTAVSHPSKHATITSSLESNYTVKTGYFGGEEGVAVSAANCLQKIVQQKTEKASEITIGYASGVYDKEKMMHSDIDILFVGLGFPKQEKFVLEHIDEIPATIIMVVGGAMDFYSGKIKRAPSFLRSVGLEWLFRLIIQPWRIWRQLRLLHFGALILLEALGGSLKSSKK